MKVSKMGRPKGSLTRRLRAIRGLTNRAIAKMEKIPLQVMLENMQKFDDEANVLFEELKDLVQNKKPPKRASTTEMTEYMDRVLSLMSKTREARMDAQKCAMDAAPYVHQKLAQVQVVTDPDDVMKAKPEHAMSDDELSDYYNRLRMRPASDAPLIIDNDTGVPIANEDDLEDAD